MLVALLHHQITFFILFVFTLQNYLNNTTATLAQKWDTEDEWFFQDFMINFSNFYCIIQ